ncbi:putative 60S ribosomal protein L21-A [Blattamonas nauphoetae]|uniref:60S ribosomal protein L21-A n=1 Tax=Blattamonas nauphoetae TaxID=2049346 RepID=A0ABQ9Y6E9_9EUKA|nr:putative 60S ribosomal protein L21-A [Blattamonas nauphoetae]
MPHSWGLRARSKTLFQKEFRQHGTPSLSTYMQPYKLGDYVDIKVDSAIHKGMPHKFYHGKTGRIWNISKRAIGVEVNKRVGNRIIKKRLSVRVEHVKKSKCRDDYLARIKAGGAKRQPVKPRKACYVNVKKGSVITVTPKPYKLIV